MPARPPNTPGLQEKAKRAIDRRSFLVAAPAAGLAAGAAALAGSEEGPTPGADPDLTLAYSETPHIQAYYRRARY